MISTAINDLHFLFKNVLCISLSILAFLLSQMPGKNSSRFYVRTTHHPGLLKNKSVKVRSDKFKL